MKLKNWLDHARAGTDADLTEAARLWVVVQRPLLQHEILKDLEPIPEKNFKRARVDLESLIAAYLKKQSAGFLLGFRDDGSAEIEIDHHFSNDQEQAWHDFVEFVLSKSRSSWRMCVQCGSAFEAKRGSPNYCSDSCRTLAYQKRKAERAEK